MALKHNYYKNHGSVKQLDKDESKCFVSGSLVAVLDGFLSGWLSVWGMHDYMRVNCHSPSFLAF